MKKFSAILDERQNPDRPKNLSTEFQVYGVYLAESLGDTKHYSLYIKLAKQYSRGLLEEALTYTKGYLTAKNKGRVFMWRLKQLRDQQRLKVAETTVQTIETAVLLNKADEPVIER